MTGLRETIVRQFGRPHGLLGRAAGLVMQKRPSNRERNKRIISLLDIEPDDYVLEIGFGPGLAIEQAAALAQSGKVVGIDHSELMVREARRRNAAAIEAGRVELHQATAEQLGELSNRFDKAFAINVYMFWKDPVAVLRALRGVMNPGGLVALATQPRNRGASNDDAEQFAERMANSLRDAGLVYVRTEIVKMSPVNLACALCRAPRQSTDSRV